MCFTNPHVIVLDEPTNHLDIRSKDILKEALMKFNGTLIIVSHDRDFLQGLTNKTFYFSKGNWRDVFHVGHTVLWLFERSGFGKTDIEMGKHTYIQTDREND